jgi:uncharacterized protein (UPF0335 family)
MRTPTQGRRRGRPSKLTIETHERLASDGMEGWPLENPRLPFDGQTNKSAPRRSGNGVNAEALSRYVERLASLENERDQLRDSSKAVYAEAREAGFVPRIIRLIVREFRMEGDAREAQYELLYQYREALGMLRGTPLGDAAERAFAAK